MRLLIQRVSESYVSVANEKCGEIQKGLLVFLGIHKDDSEQEIPWLVNKLLHLRLFSDQADKMNLNVKEVGGGVLIISQFTLYGNCMNGRRPDFIEAAPPAKAEPLYNRFVQEVAREIPQVQTGRFGAKMDVFLINDGPVTFIIEGKT